MLADARTRAGRNGRHALVGMLRQSVFGRLAGYEDVNDAQRLRNDPAMRCIVGGKAASGCAASASQMSRFETRWLALRRRIFRCSLIFPANGSSVFMVAVRRKLLDMDFRASPTRGEQENSAWNGHYDLLPLFVFNQLAICNAVLCVPAMYTARMAGMAF